MKHTHVSFLQLIGSTDYCPTHNFHYIYLSLFFLPINFIYLVPKEFDNKMSSIFLLHLNLDFQHQIKMILPQPQSTQIVKDFSCYCSFSYFVAFSLSRSLCIVEFLLVFCLWFLELPLPQIEQPSKRMQSRGKKCLEKKNQT